MTKNDIYLEMRRRICLLDYQPGTRLNERELATEFGVSRTPMRAVLQKLEHIGLISSQHGHGTIVTSIDLKSMRDVYIVRMRLMDALGDSAPSPRNPAILDEMRELEARCDAMLDSHDKREFARVLLRLHKILHGLTTNAVLEDINDTLFYQSARFWFLLLDRVEMRVQVEDLKDEIRILRRSLEIGDIKLTASIHKTYLRVVVSRLDAIQEEGGVLFEAE
ncbi:MULTISPECIES: GntR family transcriptional regulator [Ruegeria]|uniref:GntR family transcriptional regulator n=1 Tax=Ruegeria TaxID=97050 RepID=UPI00147B69AD|nr:MULTISPECIES: GntR family transcriptional regulator [Ruegeria]